MFIIYRLDINNWWYSFHTHAHTAVQAHMSDFDELMTKDDITEYVKLYTELMGDPPTAP